MTKSTYWVTIQLHTVFEVEGESEEANRMALNVQVAGVERVLPGACDWRVVNEEHNCVFEVCRKCGNDKSLFGCYSACSSPDQA